MGTSEFIYRSAHKYMYVLVYFIGVCCFSCVQGVYMYIIYTCTSFSSSILMYFIIPTDVYSNAYIIILLHLGV